MLNNNIGLTFLRTRLGSYHFPYSNEPQFEQQQKKTVYIYVCTELYSIQFIRSFPQFLRNNHFQCKRREGNVDFIGDDNNDDDDEHDKKNMERTDDDQREKRIQRTKFMRLKNIKIVSEQSSWSCTPIPVQQPNTAHSFYARCARVCECVWMCVSLRSQNALRMSFVGRATFGLHTHTHTWTAMETHPTFGSNLIV